MSDQDATRADPELARLRSLRDKVVSASSLVDDAQRSLDNLRDDLNTELRDLEDLETGLNDLIEELENRDAS